MKMIQLNMSDMLTDAIGSVFDSKDIVNKDQKVVGSAMGMRSRKDIAVLLNLQPKKDKDEIENAVEENSVEAFRVLKGKIASLEGFGLHKLASRQLTNGQQQLTVTLRSFIRKGPSDEAIAKALGIPVEQVAKIRKEQLAKLAQQQIEAEPAPAAETPAQS